MSDITKVAEQLNARVAQLNMERSRQLGMQESAKKQYENALATYKMKYGVELTEQNLQAEYNKVYAEVKGKVEALQESIESIQRGDYKNIERPTDIDLEPEVEAIRPITKVAPTVKPVQAVNNPGSIPPPPINYDLIGETKPVAPIQQPQTTVKPIDKKAPLDFAALNAAQAKPINAFEGINFDEEDEDLGVVQPTQTQKPAVNSISSMFGSGLVQNPTPTPAPQGLAVKPQGLATKPNAPKFEEEEDDDNESFTPEGWGTPKSADDLNSNFADILGQSGIKFGM